eukprot:3691312-Rhodomonas_salina.1
MTNDTVQEIVREIHDGTNIATGGSERDQDGKREGVPGSADVQLRHPESIPRELRSTRERPHNTLLIATESPSVPDIGHEERRGSYPAQGVADGVGGGPGEGPTVQGGSALTVSCQRKLWRAGEQGR